MALTSRSESSRSTFTRYATDRVFPHKAADGANPVGLANFRGFVRTNEGPSDISRREKRE
jgi:hypothetical protein